MKKYQQGDVVLLKVTKKQFEHHVSTTWRCEKYDTSENSRHELALGEETGHCHAVYFEDMLDEAGVTVYKTKWSNDPTQSASAVEVKEESVTLKHEEHNPITLPKGFYIQRIVKEYDPLTGVIRGVID
ncbi:MAG: hypothetical protein GOVbin2066_22 [Prokaryotic dsDNA virus sp.]|nr:MAG: hypothetical protein GOVbin2066_22 [Prokaryotic dsDNA virus sp.]|tara:strand:+ start:328 stop:711 length:384 start_codon:yes stop_codon:yes gene_type:complete